MALQNLMGNLALDATSQDIKTLIQNQSVVLDDIGELTGSLNYLTTILANGVLPKNIWGAGMVDLSRTTSNAVSQPIYTTMRQVHSGSIGVDLIMVPFNYSTIAANTIYQQFIFG